MMRNSSVTSRGPELGSFSLPGHQQRRELQKPTFSTKTYLQHPLKVRPAVGRNAVGLGFFLVRSSYKRELDVIKFHLPA